MKTIRFTKSAGEIQDGVYVYDLIYAVLGILPNGKYRLKIEKDVQKRSLDQNRLLWLWLTCIERETGTENSIVHDYYCAKFLRNTAIINGRVKEVVSGTSKLNTAQFKDLLDKVQADVASEFGIRLPNPEDLAFEAFCAEYEKYID